jgi:hypothetical protein
VDDRLVARDDSGVAGEVRFINADCVEDSNIVEAEGIELGTGMALDQQAELHQSCGAYDKNVVEVISGFGGLGWDGLWAY